MTEEDLKIFIKQNLVLEVERDCDGNNVTVKLCFRDDPFEFASARIYIPDYRKD